MVAVDAPMVAVSVDVVAVADVEMTRVITTLMMMVNAMATVSG